MGIRRQHLIRKMQELFDWN